MYTPIKRAQYGVTGDPVDLDKMTIYGKYPVSHMLKNKTLQSIKDRDALCSDNTERRDTVHEIYQQLLIPAEIVEFMEDGMREARLIFVAGSRVTGMQQSRRLTPKKAR